jgi:transposase
MKFITGSCRNQTYFTTLEEQIAKDNPVRLIDAFVERLDLSAMGLVCTITEKQKKQKHNMGGAPKFAPHLFLKLYLYGYLHKIRSSRKLEKECERNIELRWLITELTPNYHSIADFRKVNATLLKNLFKLYVQFLIDCNLIGKQTIAIDGSKFRAVNSKKHNHNQRKIDKHQQFILDKTAKYLEELDALDTLEATSENNSNELLLKKEKIAEGLLKLKERKIKYDALQQQLDATTDKQISTTDIDSRAILITKSIVEVAYNTQNAVDDKYNLIVHTEATNTNDGKALYKAAIAAKANLELTKEQGIIALADKGYHTGAELQQCQQANIITHVAYKEQPSVKHIEASYLSENFIYNKESDNYICPAGAELTSLGTWHNKKGEANETSYRFKTYRTDACKTCSLKSNCTKLSKRIIQRSEYQDAVDINDNNIKQNPQYYKRRQAIVEHPFGTIKRSWGYTYTLLKGLHKVNGEMNLVMFSYNFMRTQNILGFCKMMDAIKNWKPNYKGMVCVYKNTLIKLILRPNKPVELSEKINTCFLIQAA